MRAAVLLAVATGLVVVGAALWHTHELGPDPDADSKRPVDRAEEQTGPPPTQAHGPDAHDGDHDPLVGSDDVWRDLADPTHSDLPADDFHAATKTAVEVVTADATGRGRDQWPDYWPTGDHRACCTDVTIHSATARTHPHHDRLVSAIVAWSPRTPDAAGRERVTTLTLSHRNSAWQPISDP